MSIEELPDGRWRLRLRTAGRTGPRIQETLPPMSRRDAETVERERMVAIDRERRKKRTLDPSVADLIARWEELHLPTLAEQTQRASKRYLARFEAILGTIRGEALTALDIEEYRARRREKGASPSLINREMTVFWSVLSRAVIWKLLPHHPIPRGAVKPFAEAQGRLVFFERSEWAAFRGAFRDHDRTTS